MSGEFASVASSVVFIPIHATWQGAMSLGEAWKDSPMISAGLDKKGK